MKSALTSILAILSLASCSSLQSINPTYDLVDYPGTNTVSKVNIGDTVVEKGKRYTFDAIQLSGPISKAAGFSLGYEIPAQKLPAVYSDSRYTYYAANRMISKDLLLGSQPANGGICVPEDNPSEIRVYIIAGACVFRVKAPPALNRTKVAAETAPGFVQELIYNGRVDNFVKFLYREFSNTYARDAFSQEVQYDLSDGNEIGFKDARIEIVSATNTELEYRVITSFPDPE